MSRLSLQNLSSGYDGVAAVRGVCIDVQPGEFVALVGPNGAGKSTVLRAINDECKVLTGRILLDGTPIDSWSINRRVAAGIAFVTDRRNVLRSLTVRENLQLALRLGRDGECLLSRPPFNRLSSRLAVRARSLSGGETSILAIAMALVRLPRVLVADELSEGLSPGAIGEVYEAMNAWRAACNASMLFTDQSVAVIRSLSNRILVMNQGQVQEYASREEAIREWRLIDEASTRP